MKTKLWIAAVILVFAAFLFGPAMAKGQQTETTATQEILTVEEAVICTGVVDRVPEGIAETFPASVEKLYCFTKISGAEQSTTIKHVWFQGDDAVSTIELAIDGSPWRTWSYKTITTDMTGAWTVDIQDANGNVIKTLNFTIQ